MGIGSKLRSAVKTVATKTASAVKAIVSAPVTTVKKAIQTTTETAKKLRPSISVSPTQSVAKTATSISKALTTQETIASVAGQTATAKKLRDTASTTSRLSATITDTKPITQTSTFKNPIISIAEGIASTKKKLRDISLQDKASAAAFAEEKEALEIKTDIADFELQDVFNPTEREIKRQREALEVQRQQARLFTQRSIFESRLEEQGLTPDLISNELSSIKIPTASSTQSFSEKLFSNVKSIAVIAALALGGYFILKTVTKK